MTEGVFSEDLASDPILPDLDRGAKLEELLSNYHQNIICHENTEKSNWDAVLKGAHAMTAALDGFVALASASKPPSSDMIKAQALSMRREWAGFTTSLNSGIAHMNAMRRNIDDIAVAAIDTVISQRPPGYGVLQPDAPVQVDVRNPALGQNASYLDDDVSGTEMLQLSLL